MECRPISKRTTTMQRELRLQLTAQGKRLPMTCLRCKVASLKSKTKEEASPRLSSKEARLVNKWCKTKICSVSSNSKQASQKSKNYSNRSSINCLRWKPNSTQRAKILKSMKKSLNCSAAMPFLMKLWTNRSRRWATLHMFLNRCTRTRCKWRLKFRLDSSNMLSWQTKKKLLTTAYKSWPMIAESLFHQLTLASWASSLSRVLRKTTSTEWHSLRITRIDTTLIPQNMRSTTSVPPLTSILTNSSIWARLWHSWSSTSATSLTERDVRLAQ